MGVVDIDDDVDRHPPVAILLRKVEDDAVDTAIMQAARIEGEVGSPTCMHRVAHHKLAVVEAGGRYPNAPGRARVARDSAVGGAAATSRRTAATVSAFARHVILSSITCRRAASPIARRRAYEPPSSSIACVNPATSALFELGLTSIAHAGVV
jgi:microcompartment protein CcmK/EutM